MIKGLITALVTPFDGKYNFDETGFRKNIQHQLESQVDGLVLLGTTGESPTLTEDEKCMIIQTARDAIKDHTPLIVGTGSYSTAHTIHMTKRAKDLGADAALIITPYYNRPTQEGLFHHFREITEAVSIPIILYNHPGRCGTAISIETMKRLAEIPTIIGVKEITSSIDHLNECTQALPTDFSLFSGDDSSAFTFIAHGGVGLISVASNLIPTQIKELINCCLSGDISRAREMHQKLLPLFKALNIETNPIPIKAAMNLAGFPAGPCRLPLCDLQPENAQKLHDVLSFIPESIYG